MDARQEKIRKRAYQLWLDEGQPTSKAEHHWDLACEMIDVEEGMQSTLVPVSKARAGEPVEPIEALENLGEFPTTTDQGEMKMPKRRPSPRL